MTRHTSSPASRRNAAVRRGGSPRWVTFLLIAAAVAGNVASCRDFDLNDAQAGGGGSSACAGTSSAGHGGNGSSSETGGQFAGASGDDSKGGAGYGGVDAVTMAGTPGDGGTSGARGAETAISPSVLSGVVLWLEGSEASFESNESRVSKWKDSSKRGNDATEPDTAFQPRLIANALNGLPVVTFDGTPSNLIVSDDASLQFGTESFTVAFVGEWHNDATPKFTVSGAVITYTYPGYGFILIKTSASEPYDGIALFANFPAPFGTVDAQRRLGLQLEIGTASMTSRATDLNDTQFRLYVVRRTAPGLIEQRINGTEQGRAEIPQDIDSSAPGRSIYLGGSMENPLDGSLAEVVMIKGELSDVEVHGLESYLMDKFGLQ